MRAETSCLGRRIWAQVQKLDDGFDAGVYGGDASHVGAVSLAEASGTVQTLTRSGHKDAAVSEHWALTLSRTWQSPVCVRCGIHFDDFTKEALPLILQACDTLLSDILAQSERKTDL